MSDSLTVAEINQIDKWYNKKTMLKIIKRLWRIGKGSNQETKDNTFRQLLKKDCLGYCLDFVLNEGTWTETVNKLKNNELFGCILRGNSNNTRKLLKKGATPGHSSILDVVIHDQENALETIKMLFEYGVDINYSGCGFSALCFAIPNKREDVAEFLIRNGAYLDNPRYLPDAINHGLFNTVELLLEMGVDPNKQLNNVKLNNPTNDVKITQMQEKLRYTAIDCCLTQFYTTMDNHEKYRKAVTLLLKKGARHSTRLFPLKNWTFLEAYYAKCITLEALLMVQKKTKGAFLSKDLIRQIVSYWIY